jgi:L-cystine uptake protein TcyP (sodium:dicarboxylate symporter family)
MENILNVFFFADKLPQFIQSWGVAYGVDMACMCSVPNFFNLILHLLIGGFIIWMMATHKELIKDKFFLLLLIGIIFSGASKFFDWYMNMRSATGAGVYFNNQLDVLIELLQLIGIGIIFYGIISKLFYVHHARSSNN